MTNTQATPRPTSTSNAPTVILRHCASYDTSQIQGIIAEGLSALALVPEGRVLVKPNVVISGKMFPHAYTKPEFACGLLSALRDRAKEPLTELAYGERCGITVPTRFALTHAGYGAIAKQLPDVRRYHFDEVPQIEVSLNHAGRLRDYVFIPEPVMRADFFVNAPKFKAHPWSTVTFSLKNYIGLQDDRHRLIDHDHTLDRKILDLQYVIQPRFIAVDGIIAGQGRMLTPKPFPLNLIVMGNNQVAVDVVCSHIVGLSADAVEHIRLAGEAGFGPLDISTIKILGDVTLEQARERARGFEVGRKRVETYFAGTKISAYAGPPPAAEKTDYCWGGCPGAICEAIEILRAYDKQCDEKMPRLHVVFGNYQGPIPAQRGEKVVFIGDCATWSGTLHGAAVNVPNVYQTHAARDPRHAKYEGIFAKMARIVLLLFRRRRDTFVRLTGCPVSVAEQVLTLAVVGKTKNPYFAGDQLWFFNRAYVAWRCAQLWGKIAFWRRR